MMSTSPRTLAVRRPSRHHSTNRPTVSSSLRAGTTMESSGSATSLFGMSNRTALSTALRVSDDGSIGVSVKGGDVTSGFLQPLEGSDLIESLRDFTSGEL